MKIIAHRGAKGLAPENTVASIKKALEFKVDGIEFDLRVTKDNIVIVHQDQSLIDPSGNKLTIDKTDFSELRSHKPDLATFQEVLSAIGKVVPMYIEVKPGVPTGPIIKILKKHLAKDLGQKDLLLGSFSQRVLLELRAALPDISIYVIQRWSSVRAVWRAKRVNAKIIGMNQHFLWFGFIRYMKHRGYELYAYTLNDPVKAKRWAKYGLSGVVTDFPDRFAKP